MNMALLRSTARNSTLALKEIWNATMRRCIAAHSAEPPLASDDDSLIKLPKLEKKPLLEPVPSNSSIVLFPGQGTQYVGMGKDLLHFQKAQELYEMASEILKFNLRKLCLEGPVALLNRTEYAQLAVMVTSLASLEKLKSQQPDALATCTATAGFSLGEITALVFAGAIPFDKGIELVKVRADAMQRACDRVDSGMALVLFGHDTKLSQACLRARQWCLDSGVENPCCSVANFMYPDCKVIAGHMKALQYLEQNATALKIRHLKYLRVSGAFHTPLMESAVEPVKEMLSTFRVEAPIINVYSNVDAKRLLTASQVVHSLPKQIVRPVRWEQILHSMYTRPEDKAYPRTYECGPGSGLTQVLRKVNAKAAEKAKSMNA